MDDDLIKLEITLAASEDVRRIEHALATILNYLEKNMALNTDALKAAIEALKSAVAAGATDKADLLQAKADLAAAQTQVDALTAEATTAPVA
jgi:outer membrane protein TolC